MSGVPAALNKGQEDRMIVTQEHVSFLLSINRSKFVTQGPFDSAGFSSQNVFLTKPRTRKDMGPVVLQETGTDFIKTCWVVLCLSTATYAACW